MRKVLTFTACGAVFKENRLKGPAIYVTDRQKIYVSFYNK